MSNAIPVSEYYSIRHKEEFCEAIDRAKANGTLDNWSWHQLLGMIPPPVEPDGPEQWTSYCAVCGARKTGVTLQAAKDKPCPERAYHPQTSHSA